MTKSQTNSENSEKSEPNDDDIQKIIDRKNHWEEIRKKCLEQYSKNLWNNIRKKRQ